jgi:hypothetical protein
VEYLENSNTVRFATFARGVWDFSIKGLVLREDETASLAERLHLFPNPAADQITVDLSGTSGKAQSIKILNGAGQLVFEKRAYFPEKSLVLDLKDWAPGVYFITLDFGNGQTLTDKFIHL